MAQTGDGLIPRPDRLSTNPLVKPTTKDTEAQTTQVNIASARRNPRKQLVLTAAEWHRRMAHASHTLLRNSRLGLSFAPSKEGECECEVCKLAHMTRIAMTGRGQRWVTINAEALGAPQYFWQADLVGPMIKSFLGKHRYFLTFSSPCGAMRVLPLKSKNTSGVCTGLLKVLAQLPAGTVRYLQCDSGGEFVSARFQLLI